jgi:hypothetical protein
MKILLVTLAVVGLLAGSAYASTKSWSRAATAPNTVTTRKLIPQNVMWGHVKAFTRKGSSYQMKFDPGWFLTGTAAEHAALEDTGSRDVPNDVYTLEEGHRLLTFTVLPSARINVLTAPGEWQRVTPAQFVQIVKGQNPTARKIFEPQAGYWIRIGEKYPNPALTLDQQYQP